MPIATFSVWNVGYIQFFINSFLEVCSFGIPMTFGIPSAYASNLHGFIDENLQHFFQFENIQNFLCEKILELCNPQCFFH